MKREFFRSLFSRAAKSRENPGFGPYGGGSAC